MNSLSKFYKISAILAKIKIHCTLVHSVRFLLSKIKCDSLTLL